MEDKKHQFLINILIKRNKLRKLKHVMYLKKVVFYVIVVAAMN